MNTSSYTGKRVLSDFGIATEDDLDALVREEKMFDAFVYTPISLVASELYKRRENKSLSEKVSFFLKGTLPEPFQLGPRLALLRYVVTPNYETTTFLKYTSFIPEFAPLLGEYTQDKFTPCNMVKKNLGKITFFSGINKNGDIITEHTNIINFSNLFQDTHVADIITHWDQSLVDFHREFFLYAYPSLSPTIRYDMSHWFHTHGKKAETYYHFLMMLFIKDGILFEDFIYNSNEFTFIKKVFLPAFIRTIKITGFKPLIVKLRPEEKTYENVSLCYSLDMKDFVNKKINKNIF